MTPKEIIAKVNKILAAGDELIKSHGIESNDDAEFYKAYKKNYPNAFKEMNKKKPTKKNISYERTPLWIEFFAAIGIATVGFLIARIITLGLL